MGREAIMSENKGAREPSGIIILDKREGISSQGAVNRIKSLLGVKKAGHTGTLDPLATGVLPVLVGRAVKASEYMLTEDKHYISTLLLGVTTDTEDVTGGVLSTSDRIPTEKEVMAAAESFVGSYTQTPPMFSAIKIGGKKLYELAREGKTVEREPREVTVYSIVAEKLSEREYSLAVHCSKGTYIRTLCADIGAKLGVGGVMKTLKRSEAAGFCLEEAHTLVQIEEMSEEERLSLLIPVEKIFEKHPAVVLPEFFARLASSGLEIYLRKIAISLEVGERVRLLNPEGEFFALGEVREFEDGRAIKPIKQF